MYRLFIIQHIYKKVRRTYQNIFFSVLSHLQPYVRNTMGGKHKASLPITHLPSTISNNHPYKHHLQISFSPLTYPCSLLFWAWEISHKLHLPIYVSYCFVLPTTRSDVNVSIHSCPGNNRYLEVLRSDVFQLRSTNFMRPHHHTLHSIGFPALSSSIHHQPVSCLVPTRRSVHSTRQIQMTFTQISTFNDLVLQSATMVFCNILTVFCLYNFRGWVLVSLADPFSRAFDLLLVVPAFLYPLHRGCYSLYQISTRPILSSGLFWTGLKAFAQVMPLFFTGLVFSPTCLDKSLALSKVDRAGPFLVLLELKKHSFPPSCDRHGCIRFGFCWGIPPLCFYFL
jgi:hypothetical protein